MKNSIDFNVDYYEILGVDANDIPKGKDPNSRRFASNVLRTAYHKKLFEVHPDRPNGDAEKCKLVVKAHQILSDPALREIYDNGENQTVTENGEIRVNWNKIGKYRKGSLSEMIGSALYDKIMNHSGIENIEAKFIPFDEESHNYHWEFTVEGLPKELVLSIVEDEREVLRLTSGDDKSIKKSLPFKIYICLPSVKLVMVRDDNVEVDSGTGYIDVLKGKIQNAQFIDADIMGSTNFEDSVNFIESGELKEAVEQCINGNLDPFLKKFKKRENTEVNAIMQRQEVFKKDQEQLKTLLDQAKVK